VLTLFPADYNNYLIALDSQAGGYFTPTPRFSHHRHPNRSAYNISARTTQKTSILMVVSPCCPINMHQNVSTKPRLSPLFRFSGLVSSCIPKLLCSLFQETEAHEITLLSVYPSVFFLSNCLCVPGLWDLLAVCLHIPINLCQEAYGITLLSVRLSVSVHLSASQGSETSLLFVYPNLC
jgi:hypothetical protein